MALEENLVVAGLAAGDTVHDFFVNTFNKNGPGIYRLRHRQNTTGIYSRNPISKGVGVIIGTGIYCVGLTGAVFLSAYGILELFGK